MEKRKFFIQRMLKEEVVVNDDNDDNDDDDNDDDESHHDDDLFEGRTSESIASSVTHFIAANCSKFSSLRNDRLLEGETMNSTD